MATAKKNEIAKNEGNGELAVLTERPAWLTEGSHRGSEDVGMDDIILPRIDVLQALSPQIKKKDPKYIEGAEQGILFNSVTGELYGDSLQFVPVVFKREFIVWQDRDAGGGFKGAFPTAEQAERERSMQENPDQLEVVETHVHYIIILRDDGKLEEAVLSLAKSKRKVSRTLNTLVQMVPVDRFARVYKLSAVEASGPKGDYWNVDVKNVGYAPEEAYKKGEEMYKAVMAGERGIDRSTGDEEGPAGNATV